MVRDLYQNFSVALLVFVRIMAMLRVAPLISSRSIPGVARVAIALFSAVAVYPWVVEAGYPIPDRGGHYLLLVLGEALVGLIIGFFMVVVFSGFQVAGQFFSLQMGLGASQVFDPLAQIEIPLMGQFLYVVAMLVFVMIGGFQKFLLVGVIRSFESLRAADLVAGRELVFGVFVRSLGKLFENSLVISFPILGTLMLTSVSLGLLAKAAPQMNLLMMGFPISIAVAYLVLLFVIPFLMTVFGEIIDGAFAGLQGLYDGLTGGGRP